MYVKVFSSVYDGTLATHGPWQALVTFQQMLILSDPTGVVDMTPEAISRRTTIPLEIIAVGIAALEQPDPESRLPNDDGRRIVRLDDHRTWGWQIVNFVHYRNIRNAEERREYQRQWVKDKRLQASTAVDNVDPRSKQRQRQKQETIGRPKSAVAPSAASAVRFEDFWIAWPPSRRKNDRKACQTLWAKRGLDRIADQIIGHVTAMKRCSSWTPDFAGNSFEPSPRKYLDNERWRDPLPPDIDGTPKIKRVVI